ncbi:glycosyltransferase family 2 protein [Thiohalocapsa marina]|uniref:Glycosyltransferase family 2 protein n=2 Tax=Thiohalocapsa marina TaxID=424902 RepID=A0A5M8FHA9_9GAMM|nr:glycosyltransferase family 2 protein [Thiohalocapsa marina]
MQHDRPDASHPPPADVTCAVTVLMPCLDEAATIGRCIDKARRFLQTHDIAGEVLVADNGSSDGSAEIATARGARVLHVQQKGYGNALMAGIAAARGEFVIMGDADDSYDFANLEPFVQALHGGFQLVMGNRFQGGIRAGAMPPLHRYLGNPLLSGVGRIFFNSPVGDFHCGLRGFSRQAILGLDLRSTGMEFASEMVVKASIEGLRITEVPTTLSPDGRDRPPHLRSWRDGWRHLRFLLLYSPDWLFFYPGIVLFAAGLMASAWLLPGPRTVLGLNLDIHTLLFAAAGMILGLQSISFAFFAKLYGMRAGFLPPTALGLKIAEKFRLEHGLILGLIILLGGISGSVFAVGRWGAEGFGDLVPGSMMRLIIPSATAVIIGVQITLSAMLLGVLQIPVRDHQIASKK